MESQFSSLKYPQNLDIQYTVGVASGVPNTFVSVGDNNEDGLDGFLDEINQLLSLSNPPQVRHLVDEGSSINEYA